MYLLNFTNMTATTNSTTNSTTLEDDQNGGMIYLYNLIAQCLCILSILVFLSALLELKLFKISIRLALIIELFGCGIFYYNVLMILLIIATLIVLPIFYFAAKLDIRSYRFSLLVNCLLYVVAFILLFTMNHCCNAVTKKRAKRSTASLSSKLENIDEHIPEMEDLQRNEEETKWRLVPLLNEISKALLHDKEELMLLPILTGSAAEHFSVPLSNEDGQFWGITRFNKHNRHAMLSDHDFLIENVLEKASFNSGGDFLIDCQAEFLHPGFVRVVAILSGSIVSAKDLKTRIHDSMTGIDIRDIDGFDSNQSSATLGSFPKVFIVGGYGHITQKGPAVCLHYHILGTKFMYADLTYGIRCEGEWPPLSDWPTRAHRKWPDDGEVDRIVKMGFHLVPKSQPINDEEEITWRYSFSIAEVELSNLIHPTARKCFIALKIIAKDFLKQRCRNFKSYYLKTLFLHTLETTEPTRWHDDDIEFLFHMLLDAVIGAVKAKCCPHFWIQNVNLFDNLTDDDFNNLGNILREIKDRPQDYINCLEKKTRWWAGDAN